MHKKIFLLILIDQITKLIFSNRDFFIPPLHVHLVKNYGLVGSLNFGLIPNLILVALGLIFFIYYFWQYRLMLSQIGQWVFILIFAGAISNIIDRIYLGYVRDFLDLGLGFTFNLADVFVAAGLVMVLFFESHTKTDLDF